MDVISEMAFQAAASVLAKLLAPLGVVIGVCCVLWTTSKHFV
jgi:hypothetical protein